MEFGKNVRRVREAKNLSSKEVALACKMDPAQYSRVENNKADITLSTIRRIAKALGVGITDLFKADHILKEVNVIDKRLMQKINLFEKLDKQEKSAILLLIHKLVAKKK